jgi:hypothetical protein
MQYKDTENGKVCTLVERNSLLGEGLRTKNGDGRKWILKRKIKAVEKGRKYKCQKA